MASTVIGTCRLCQRTEVQIKNSHIIPKWTFRKIGKQYPEEGYELPVIITEGVAEQKQDQFTEHLLCRACELRLCQLEDHVARQVRQQDGTFPALTTVTNRGTRSNSGEFQLGDPTDLNIAALTRFAISVIWRASVSRVFPRAHIDEPYEEQFRLFLLDDGWSFPEDAVLALELIEELPDDEQRIDHLATSPTTSPESGYVLHWFCLFGLHFRLFVGPAVPMVFQQLCVVRAKMVAISRGRGLLEQLAGKARESEVKGDWNIRAEQRTAARRSRQTSSK